MVCDVCNPIVRIDVVMTKEVETIETYPDVLQVETPVFLILTFESTETHTDIHTLICWSTEFLTIVVSMWWSEWQSVSKGETQRHTPAVCTWEIVGKEEVNSIALVSRKRNGRTSVFHTSLHQWEWYPRVCSWYELTIEFEVDTCYISVTFVDAVIGNLDVVDRVGNEVWENLIISLCSKLKRTICNLKA